MKAPTPHALLTPVIGFLGTWHGAGSRRVSHARRGVRVRAGGHLQPLRPSLPPVRGPGLVAGRRRRTAAPCRLGRAAGGGSSPTAGWRHSSPSPPASPRSPSAGSADDTVDLTDEVATPTAKEVNNPPDRCRLDLRHAHVRPRARWRWAAVAAPPLGDATGARHRRAARLLSSTAEMWSGARHSGSATSVSRKTSGHACVSAFLNAPGLAGHAAGLGAQLSGPRGGVGAGRPE